LARVRRGKGRACYKSCYGRSFLSLQYCLDFYVIFLIVQMTGESVRILFQVEAIRVGNVTYVEPQSDGPNSELTDATMFCNPRIDHVAALVSSAHGWSILQDFFQLSILIGYLAAGNNRMHFLLRKLPRYVYETSSNEMTDWDRLNTVKWLRECFESNPVEFRVAGIYVGFGKMFLIIAPQAIVIIMKFFQEWAGHVSWLS